MNYYEHHIGDYAAATAHLSLIEDAIYSRMLRRYYLTEAPLPADVAHVARLMGVPRDSAGHDTVQAILSEFFTLEDDGWHQKRCDENIAIYREKQVEADKGREHEAERKRLYRERRSELFQQLRALGIVPAFDTTTAELVRLLSRGTGQGQDGDGTANQTPSSNHQSPVKQKQELSTESAFDRWWAVYPKKTARKAVEQRWQRRGLDSIADQLIADVLNRKANDDKWRSGFAPEPMTYINQDRWNDDLSIAPVARSATSEPSKTLGAMQTLQGIKHGLASNRTVERADEVALIGSGSDPGE